MGRIATSIKEKLTKAFNPSQLEIIDESHKHAGHGGMAEHNQKLQQDGKEIPSGETHFVVKITADVFEDKTLLARHRLIMEELDEEMQNGIHALSLKINS